MNDALWFFLGGIAIGQGFGFWLGVRLERRANFARADAITARARALMTDDTARVVVTPSGSSTDAPHG